MNEVKIIEKVELGQIRLIEIGEKNYFVGNDIAKVLEYVRPYEAVSAHCKGGGKLPCPF